MLWVCDVWWSDPERHICASSHYCLLCMTSHWSDSRYHLFLHIPLVPLVLFTPMNIALQRLVFIANLSVCILQCQLNSTPQVEQCRERPVDHLSLQLIVSMLCICVVDMTPSSHFLMKVFLRELLICRTLPIFDIISQLSRFFPIADLKSPVAVLSCCRGQQGQIESTCVRSVEYSVTCQTVTTHPQEGQSKLEPR